MAPKAGMNTTAWSAHQEGRLLRLSGMHHLRLRIRRQGDRHGRPHQLDPVLPGPSRPDRAHHGPARQRHRPDLRHRRAPRAGDRRAGRTRSYTYDERGNLDSETDALGFTTRYTYTTPLNRLASVTDAKGNVTRYAYESDGDLASITYADGSRESRTYDTAGNRVTWTNRRGQTIRYTNDFLGA